MFKDDDENRSLRSLLTHVFYFVDPIHWNNYLISTLAYLNYRVNFQVLVKEFQNLQVHNHYFVPKQ